MDELGNILIAGTGPVAVQSAVLLAQLPGELGIAGRDSTRAAEFFTSVEHNGKQVQAQVQNPAHRALAGQARLAHRYLGYHRVRPCWDTLVMAVSADAYLPVLRALPEETLSAMKRIVLLSPTLGSAKLVGEYARRRGAHPEVISCSSYLGDSRQIAGTSGIKVLTAGVKKRIHLGTTRIQSPAADRLAAVLEAAGTAVQAASTPVEAEARNMSLYVHPALFMNEVALQAVFSPGPVPKYVYKLFPEGPVTPALIHTMAKAWRELNAITGALGGQGVNLLQFMLEDGYPVRPESIAPQTAANFDKLPAAEQEYLLYVRYASLLIDPYSQPDEHGRYFDFSAIAFRPIFINDHGQWDIPRMPKEDYYRTKIIQGLARKHAVPCPMIDQLLENYERALEDAARQLEPQPCSPQFSVEDFSEHVDMIGSPSRSAA